MQVAEPDRSDPVQIVPGHASTSSPSESSDAAASTGTLTGTLTGTVVRPAPGTIARGVWEAPPWAFYVAVVVVLLAALVYGARAAGLLRRRRPRDS